MSVDVKLSVLYVENDSTLRGLVTNILKNFNEVTNVFDFETGEESLSFAKEAKVNVALLDVSLGPGHLDGFATGRELRRLNPNIGIVLFSQNSYSSISKLIDFKGLEAWNYVEKKADIDMVDLVSDLKKAAIGVSNINLVNFKGRTIDIDRVGGKLLTQRQDVIMSLLACGFDPKYIANRLEISVEVVRKDLSAAYGILVPEPESGTDLRITSILKYQKLVGNLGLDEI